MINHIRTTDYFELYQVDSNVYAAIKNNPLSMSNAGFIDLGDRVVVFDTFISVKAAKELKKAIIDITGVSNFIVINSHSHLDHYLGNSVFTNQVPIIASEDCYSIITSNAEELDIDNNVLLKEINSMKEKLESIDDVDEILDIKNSLIIYENLLDKDCKTIPPNFILRDNMIINGSKDSIDLNLISVAHSKGEIVGITNRAKIAFMGDILVVNEHQFLGTGDPYKVKEILTEFLNSDIEYFIPGHGDICGKDKIIEQIEYIDCLISLVKGNTDDVKNLKNDDLPSKFQKYEGPGFRWNINFLAEFLKNK